MRQLHRRGLATVMLTGGALAMAGYAQADSVADGGAEHSPGVLSGNAVQLPVHIPVNACGNTVNVVGLLNPAAGNSCENTSKGGSHSDHGRGGSHGDHGKGGGSHGDHAKGGANTGGGASAEGGAEGSPGVLSGNGLQLPVDLPANVTGNSVNVVGIGNPSLGNSSSNGHAEPPSEPGPVTPPKSVTPHKPTTRSVTPAEEETDSGVQLAHTGSGAIGYAAPASAALLLGGVVLYRRSRRAGV